MKFPLTKLTCVLGSALLFFGAWAYIAQAGWSGATAAPTLPPESAPAPVAPVENPSQDPPVVIRRVNVVRRLYVVDNAVTNTDPSGAEPPAFVQQPVAAPPPQPSSPGAPAAPAPGAPVSQPAAPPANNPQPVVNPAPVRQPTVAAPPPPTNTPRPTPAPRPTQAPQPQPTATTRAS